MTLAIGTLYGSADGLYGVGVLWRPAEGAGDSGAPDGLWVALTESHGKWRLNS